MRVNKLWKWFQPNRKFIFFVGLKEKTHATGTTVSKKVARTEVEIDNKKIHVECEYQKLAQHEFQVLFNLEKKKSWIFLC